MARIGRNHPCQCGSGRKTKRCCGVRTGPSDTELAKAGLARSARIMTPLLAGYDQEELTRLCDEMLRLPARDLSLALPLPRLYGPGLQRLFRAVAAGDLDRMCSSLAAAVAEVDSPLVRDRLARAVLELARVRRIARDLAAITVIHLAGCSNAFVGASLLEALAVRAGVVRTPAGLLVASA
jgi:hypothetical protein